VELAAGELAIDQFDGTDFDHPMPQAVGDACGFGIQCDDATHAWRCVLLRAVVIFACR
jgi:hypothetical protein